MAAPTWLLRVMSFYPPYLGAGVRVKASPDLRTFEVRMKLRFWNRNYLGTQFGGSLYSMCDPFFVLILATALGGRYVVWDKTATIRFRRPGRGTVKATFHIPQETVDEIRAAADARGKVEPTFQVNLLDEQGEVVAEVEKLLYVRRKEPSPPQPSSPVPPPSRQGEEGEPNRIHGLQAPSLPGREGGGTGERGLGE